MKIMNKLAMTILSVGAISAVTKGGFLVYFGAQNNNQGEFDHFTTGV